MKAFSLKFARAALLALGGLFGGATAAGADGGRDPMQHFFETSFGDYQAELSAAARGGKKGILLVFELEECPFCERMHTTVINRTDVQTAFRSAFAIFRIDAASSQPIVAPDGTQTTPAALAKSLKAYGTPYSVVIGADGQVLARLPGAPIDGAEYLLFARFAGSGASATETFSAYKARLREAR